MKNHKRRGILATGWAVLTALTLAVGGTAAQAVTAQPVPDSTPVTITKLAQPGALGERADGTVKDVADLEGIGGVEFEYYLVPGTELGGVNDPGTNSGQAYVAGLDIETALTEIDRVTPGTFAPTHAPSGVTSATLDRGVYVIKEVPETVAGVTPSAPFLLTVPMTDPANLNQWLDNIYVYPKNTKVTGEKTVSNLGQLVVGDNVTWTIAADVPRIENPDHEAEGAPAFIAPESFTISDTLQNDELRLVNTTVKLVAADVETTLDSADYTIAETLSADESATTHAIGLTASGLQKMAAAINNDPSATIVVDLETTVLKSAEINNSAEVAFETEYGRTELPVDPASVKYGNAQITKLSPAESAVLAGAVFELYETEAAAKALDPELKVTPRHDNGELQENWTTDADGKFSITGLRYSGFADGEAFDSNDERYQTYWLVEVKALDGHQLLPEPIELTIGEDGTEFAIDVTNQPNTGGFELPLTGGQGTALLTIAGVTILGGVLFAARRREDEATV